MPYGDDFADKKIRLNVADMAENVVYKLSKQFALRIVKLYLYLRNEKHETVMSLQVYRSGTSIGANLAESVFAQSDADYINKLSIALKEANETKYWLELLYESEFITAKMYDSLSNDIKTIIGTLIIIINKLKGKSLKK